MVVPSAARAAEFRADLMALLRRHRTRSEVHDAMGAAARGEDPPGGPGTAQAGDDSAGAPA